MRQGLQKGRRRYRLEQQGQATVARRTQWLWGRLAGNQHDGQGRLLALAQRKREGQAVGPVDQTQIADHGIERRAFGLGRGAGGMGLGRVGDTHQLMAQAAHQRIHGQGDVVFVVDQQYA